ncbi:Lipoprotein signal peptidase [hydrothermal vent metagenome]|uniref:Lipoprotein signal peptidase n=1 Tax=hydrothermal vent metagenome TaxID=652676 RepID=A0A3B0S0J6_9ZZZZ
MRSDRRTDTGGETGSDSVRNDDGRGSKAKLSNRQLAITIGVLVAVFDQLTKAWALKELADGPIVIIQDVFRLRLTFNTGASFSLFSNGGVIIAIIAFGVIGLIMYMLGDASRRIEAIALGLVLGGSIGNLIDRVFRGAGILDGAVVDWIDVQFFAVFNAADVFINVGVALLLYAAFVRRS